MNGADVDARIKLLVASFDIGASDSVYGLCHTLDQVSRDLALSEELREILGRPQASIWTCLRKLWKDLCRVQLTFWEEDDEDEDSRLDQVPPTPTTPAERREHSLRNICLSLARFTRNLTAGVPDNQIRAFENEPQIRKLLHYHTSWTALRDPDSLQLARILTQTLSNLVTGHETLLQQLWETYMHLPEDQVILIRLLSSGEARIIMPALILILNLVHASRERMKMLCRTDIGVRLLVWMFDDMVLLFEAEDASDGAQAFDSGYAIFTLIVQEALIGDLYNKLAMSGEIITPQQVILLKLLDSYLQSTRPESDSPSSPTPVRIRRKLSPMLARAFFSLSGYAQKAMNRSIESPPTPSSPDLTPKANSGTFTPPAELDVMLPKVCEALVLVAQCMATIALESDIRGSDSDESVAKSPKICPKSYFNEAHLSKLGLVESLIDTLRTLDIFLPRINFGKPVTSPAAKSNSTSPIGFLYVKRDLVRLLGILCHGEKAVQDRVRECGGIIVILNLCVIDERNPFLREHAIFTLHNLLEGNIENQNVVDKLQPNEKVAVNGSDSHSP